MGNEVQRGAMQDNKESHIYHFTERHTFERAKEAGSYEPLAFSKDGFIHCSTREQVLLVANAIARRDSELVLLEIDTDKVSSRIIYENLEGGAKLFPHIYGKLDLDAIMRVWKFAPTDQRFEFPQDQDLLFTSSSRP